MKALGANLPVANLHVSGLERRVEVDFDP